MTTSTTETNGAPRKRTWLRMAALALGLAALWVIADRTGLRDALSVEALQAFAAEAGPLGVVAYLAAFALGQLAQLPGVAFILAARVAYGPVLGFLASYAGALGAVTLSFLVVRKVGGSPLGGVRAAWLRRILARLDDRPILTVALLRTFLVLSPPLSFALAMSRTRFRDHLVGSALGLLAPVAAYVFFSDCVIGALGRL